MTMNLRGLPGRQTLTYEPLVSQPKRKAPATDTPRPPSEISTSARYADLVPNTQRRPAGRSPEATGEQASKRPRIASALSSTSSAPATTADSRGLLSVPRRVSAVPSHSSGPLSRTSSTSRFGSSRSERQQVDWTEQREPHFQFLTPLPDDYDGGNIGEVHYFENEMGEQIAVKVSFDATLLRREFAGLDAAHRLIGPHECMVSLRGLGEVEIGGRMRSGMMMGRVPGPLADRFFRALDDALGDGRITNEQYWGALQFVFAKLLSLLKPLHDNGMIHNDVQRRNFALRSDSGLPVLFDFDTWSDADHPPMMYPGMPTVGMAICAPPEASDPTQIDTRSDVFRLGATIVACVEGQFRTDPETGDFMAPHEGPYVGARILQDEWRKARAACANRPPEYFDFLRHAMAPEKQDRLTTAQALEHPFMRERRLSDEQAADVIRMVVPSAAPWQAADEEYSNSLLAAVSGGGTPASLQPVGAD